MTEDGETRTIVTGRAGLANVLDQDNRLLTKYDVPYGATLLLKDGARWRRVSSSTRGTRTTR